MEALNQLEEGLKENIKKLSSFDLYKQEVLLGHLDWTPMHKDPSFWRDNVTRFEDNDFQVLFDTPFTIPYSLLQLFRKKPISGYLFCFQYLFVGIFCNGIQYILI